MPIYEFRCPSCGHEFERLQKLSDRGPEHCPRCEAAGVVRVISPVGFRLKGSGWYETDFKQSGRHNVVETGKSVDGQAQKVEAGDAGKDDGGKNGGNEKKLDAREEQKKANTRKSPDGQTAD